MRMLPDPTFLALWDSIFVSPQVKDRLLSQSVLNFTLRPKVPRTVIPLHGIILLVGPPGTGKTSLAKGVAARTAEVLTGGSRVRFVEIDPHALASASLGKSQKAVTELFRGSIAEYAAMGPTIVLLDEVETLVADRSKMSLEANPIDVHRATDAALVQLDHLAEAHPNLLFVATSNFPGAIDAAFVSRADLVLNVPTPDADGCRRILESTLEGLGARYPQVKTLVRDPHLPQLVEICTGLDGRQLRKLVGTACTLDKQTALNPGRLTMADLLAAAGTVRAEMLGSEGGAQ
jgi:SpoVK/Ycf46/Vps4 family AAA+-type ATPase